MVHLCSYELHVRSACPQTLQPVTVSCVIGPVEIKFFGMGRSFNITGLLPYASYELRVVSNNNMGSTESDWVSVTTFKERKYPISCILSFDYIIVFSYHT